MTCKICKHSSVVFTSYSDKSSDKSSDEDDDGKEDPDKKKFESQLSGEDIFPQRTLEMTLANNISNQH